MIRSSTFLVCISIVFLTSSPSAAWDKKNSRAAALAAVESFSETTFVAHMPLGRNVQYYVLPDGSPSDKSGKKQGRGPGASTIQLGSGIKVQQGATGAGIYVWALKKEVRVGFNRKRGAVLNATTVHILYDRETSPEDYDPYKIARAVSGLVEIQGFAPGDALTELLDSAAAEAAAAESATMGGRDTSPAAIGPTVTRLTVSVDPALVHRGESVKLILTYEIIGRDEIAVRETRTLAFGGQTIPTFPVVDALDRAAGEHASGYEQPLPAGASLGQYTFTGEVCVGHDCIRRSIDFEVR